MGSQGLVQYPLRVDRLHAMLSLLCTASMLQEIVAETCVRKRRTADRALAIQARKPLRAGCRCIESCGEHSLAVDHTDPCRFVHSDLGGKGEPYPYVYGGSSFSLRARWT